MIKLTTRRQPLALGFGHWISHPTDFFIHEKYMFNFLNIKSRSYQEEFLLYFFLPIFIY